MSSKTKKMNHSILASSLLCAMLLFGIITALGAETHVVSLPSETTHMASIYILIVYAGSAICFGSFYLRMKSKNAKANYRKLLKRIQKNEEQEELIRQQCHDEWMEKISVPVAQMLSSLERLKNNDMTDGDAAQQASLLRAALQSIDTNAHHLFALTHPSEETNEVSSMETFMVETTPACPDTDLDKLADEVTKKGDEVLKDLNRLINDNIDNPRLSVCFLANQMNMSRSSLFAKLKCILDTTPNELIRVAKMNKAAYLLKNGNYRINEVCYMVGFSSPSYFAKCFQKQFGVKPGEYMESV